MANVFVALDKLFRETFEGVAPGESGTWFVEGKEGIFDAFDRLNADQASFCAPGCTSVAAHLRHTWYYLSRINLFARGEIPPPADWEGSWQPERVTVEGWEELRERLRLEYEAFREKLREEPDLDQDATTGALANLAHAAYHLGAVRQLLKIAEAC